MSGRANGLDSLVGAASSVAAVVRRGSLSGEEIAQALDRRSRLRVRWDQLAAEFGVSTHQIRVDCDPTYDATILGDLAKPSSSSPTSIIAAARGSSREAIAGELVDRGGLSMDDLAIGVGMTRSYISTGLGILQRIGMVERRAGSKGQRGARFYLTAAYCPEAGRP